MEGKLFIWTSVLPGSGLFVFAPTLNVNTMFGPLVLFLVGLFMSFKKGYEEPVIVLITIFAFAWTVYELIKGGPSPEEVDAIYSGTSSMKFRDWVEMAILIFAFIWLAAVAELT